MWDRSLFILAAMTLISSFGVAVMLPLIPLYGISLGASPFQLGLLTSGFALASAAGQLFSGIVIDRLGSRGFIRGGIAVYAGANALIATANDAFSLIAFRSLAGLGSGANLVASRLYLSQIADPQRMAFVNGILSAANSTGQVIGPAFGGIVAALGDLRLPFILVSITSGLAFLAAWLLPLPPTAAPNPRDAARETATLNRATIVLLAAQLALLAGYGAIITTYAPLATTVLGWTTLEIGIAFSILGAGSILLGPYLAHLADRVGRQPIAVAACAPLVLFGITLAIALPREVIYVIVFLAGAGLTAFNAAWFALLAEASAMSRRGRTFGIVNAVAQLGTVAGALIASVIWQSIGIVPAMVSGSAFIAAAGIAMMLLESPRIHANLRE